MFGIDVHVWEYISIEDRNDLKKYFNIEFSVLNRNNIL